jgi:hypothetical protein
MRKSKNKTEASDTVEEICLFLLLWMRPMSLEALQLMAHFFVCRKNCHRADVGILSTITIGAGKLSLPRASSLFFYKTLASSRTHDLFLAP